MLNRLSHSTTGWAHIASIEFHLLKILGYGIDFLHCAGSGLPVDESMTYQYRAEKGFIASLVKDNLTFYGRDLLAFDRLEFTMNPSC